MIDVQEVRITTQQNQVFIARIEKNDDGSFTGYMSPMGGQPTIATVITPYGPSLGPKSTAIECFKDIVEAITTALSHGTGNDHITTINNPCNAPFISVDEQKGVVSPGITVTMN